MLFFAVKLQNCGLLLTAEIVKTIETLILAVALLPFAYYLLAIYAVWGHFRQVRIPAQQDDPSFPPASILKPICGVDDEAYENFASFCQQDYPQYEVLFAVADGDDPVIPVIEKIQRDFPSLDIRLMVGVERLGENRKLNSLARLAKDARYELLVISDSDVRVVPGYLREVATLFRDPQVGLVTTFFRGIAGTSLAARLEALVPATETVPNALVASKIEKKIRFAFGWTMATTKTHLQGVGGFESMVNHHSDDFELGNRIAARGLRIALLPSPVNVVIPGQSFREYWQHELRWAVGLRNVRPGGYFGLVLTFGLPWTLLAMAFAPTRGLAFSYLAAYLLLRLGQVWITGAWALDDAVTRRDWWLTPLRDAINLSVWTAGLFSSTVRWRGITYRVKKGLLFPASIITQTRSRASL